MPRLDLTGQTFGNLTVLRIAGVTRHHKIKWLCRCSCGAKTTAIGSHLMNGNTASCGCLKYRTGENAPTFKHGEASTRTYKIWRAMKSRCHNANTTSFKQYGAKGIRVCSKWQKFPAFFADMGHCPDGLSIDRIDNSKGYEPGNCRWATPKEQSRNSSRPALLTVNGRTQNLSEWAKELDIGVPTLLQRLESWPLQKALTTKNKRKSTINQPRIT